MASYPTIPDRDPRDVKSEHLIAVSRSVLGLIAMPGRRDELDDAARELENEMLHRSGPKSVGTKGKLL